MESICFIYNYCHFLYSICDLCGIIDTVTTMHIVSTMLKKEMKIKCSDHMKWKKEEEMHPLGEIPLTTNNVSFMKHPNQKCSCMGWKDAANEEYVAEMATVMILAP